MDNIDNVSLEYLTIEDYHELKTAMIDAYSNMPNSVWSEDHIKLLLQNIIILLCIILAMCNSDVNKSVHYTKI